MFWSLWYLWSSSKSKQCPSWSWSPAKVSPLNQSFLAFAEILFHIWEIFNLPSKDLLYALIAFSILCKIQMTSSERMGYLCGSDLISVSHRKMFSCLVLEFPKKGIFKIPSDEKKPKNKKAWFLVVSDHKESTGCSLLGHSL